VLKVEDLSELYTQFAELGKWSLLFRISGYNGQANDDKVRVDWYASGGFGTVPLWDGTDQWPIAESTLNGPDINLPKFFDASGYVTDNVLVFSVPDGQLDIAGEITKISLKLTGGTVMARIEKDPMKGTYVLRQGTIAARIALQDLFQMVASFRNEEGKPFCTNEAFWGATKDAFCRGLDIQTGFAEPNKPCNAVSFAAGFSADTAQLGSIQPSSDADGGCPPETDPMNDFITMPCP
jgi:hypothetical protein